MQWEGSPDDAAKEAPAGGGDGSRGSNLIEQREDIRRIAREAREQLVELGQPAQRVPCHPDRPLAEPCQIAQRPIGGVLQPVFARC